MFPTKITAISTVALTALLQLCPAPFLGTIPPAVSAAIGGGSSLLSMIGTMTGTLKNDDDDDKGGNIIEDHFSRRGKRGDVDVSAAMAWGPCKRALGSASVDFSAPATGSVHVTGLPKQCMLLAKALTDEYGDGNAVATGPDSLLLQNLSDENIKEIQDALDGHPSTSS